MSPEQMVLPLVDPTCCLRHVVPFQRDVDGALTIPEEARYVTKKVRDWGCRRKGLQGCILFQKVEKRRRHFALETRKESTQQTP